MGALAPAYSAEEPHAVAYLGGRSDDARRKRYWIKVNYDSGAAVTAFPKSFAEDSVGNGEQYKTATGELTPDYGGIRISGRVDGGSLHRLTGRLADVHKTIVSASRCTSLGRGWLMKGGGYLISDDSAISHKIKKMIQKEAERRMVRQFQGMRRRQSPCR